MTPRLVEFVTGVGGCIVLVTFVVSVWVTGFMRRYALRKNLVDVPNLRSSHVLPTPRGGGVAIVLAFLAAVGALFGAHALDGPTALALIGGGGLVAVIGFLDDRRPQSARLRLAVHVAAAVGVVSLLGVLPGELPARLGIDGLGVAFLFTVLVFAWGTNLFNFMDGIDGIAASEAIFVAAAGAALNALDGGGVGLTLAMLSICAAALGFLVWNWPPARIFMGDVGSGFLGFSLVALALAASARGRVPIEVWPILGGVFWVDATTTLLSRLIRGERWTEAHRTHAYQQLARRWRGHQRVTGGVIVVNLCWLLPWAWYANGHPDRAGLCGVAALVPVVLMALLAGAGRRE